MKFYTEENALIVHSGHETLRIEPWGQDSLRVRATLNPELEPGDWILTRPEAARADIDLEGPVARITNGHLQARVGEAGVLTFYKDGRQILHEFRRNYNGSETEQSIALKIDPREFKGILGGHWRLTARFDSDDSEHFYGMGQYQQPYMDLKGCILDLGQRNSQISVPFVLSSSGYGLLWNNPSIGRASFARNLTEFTSDCTKQLDYWICAAQTPKDIIRTYTGLTGRAPMMPEHLLGLWQCKLRYRTQEEVLEVARRYHELNIPVDVIVIDFFHWTRQGDWSFDPEYWPDVKGMCDELHSYGMKVMVSVWPTVDKKSSRFWEMKELGYLMQTEQGSFQTYDFQGDCAEVDVFNPEARKYFWNACRENYYDKGIDMFWLDNIEPDLAVYDYQNFRYYGGTHLEIGNLYPQLVAKAFHDGLKEAGSKDLCLLCRCGWAGNARYGTLIWSGDIQSNFRTLETQVMQGLNMGIAGIPWWTTDIGGFMTDDYHDPAFIELLLRWFAWAVFTPVLRMHGTRGPLDIEPLSDKDYGGGYLYTGHDNELWSYGPEAMEIMKKFLKIRLELKPYLTELYREASETGLPLMRAMMLEFPEDEQCWHLTDQYMLGSRLLVAPVVHQNQTERSVYLPEGTWRDYFDGTLYQGSRTITVKTPIDRIPVFEKHQSAC
ncbi:glycoside hydrolase family 31 protein [Faecalibaculum rodentium]|jgi:alpha-D-xyloside xylohydrolase|uniref:glycoside hydrolase family 31 protein n=2 Tax=Faecalibaculum rodentium TaxID=1702221 RepID=UPI001C3D5A1B|nr:TIM-barrel domain-containing protein [Faecalibaculum rodentium]